MPCTTQPTLTQVQKDRQRAALARLQKAIASGAVQVVLGRGSLALRGWAQEEREGISDLCAYRALANTPEMRRAVLTQEARTGQRLDPRALAAGMHSHDGGATWGTH